MPKYLNGTNGNDTIRGTTSDDVINGRRGDDYINGIEGNDVINGGDGNDGLWGEAGNDTLNGDAGVDLLEGQQGDDTLNAGAGSDSLSGGDGADTYRPGLNSDVIIEFYQGDGRDTYIYEKPDKPAQQGNFGEDYLYGFDTDVDLIVFEGYNAADVTVIDDPSWPDDPYTQFRFNDGSFLQVENLNWTGAALVAGQDYVFA